MGDTGLPTVPLSVGLAIPLLLSFPCAFVLYSLYAKRTHSWLFDPSIRYAPSAPDAEAPTSTTRSEDPTAPAEGRKKASLATLDIKSFLGRVQQTQLEATTLELKCPKSTATSNIPALLASRLKLALSTYTFSIIVSLLCGAIYLSCTSTANYSNAAKLPLGLSVTCAPFVCFAQSVLGYRSRNSRSSNILSRKQCLGFGLALPILASVVVATLGSWVSTYIVIAVLGVALSATTAIFIQAFSPAIVSWTAHVFRNSNVNKRQTRSWFSSSNLSPGDAEALAAQGRIPHSGEKEEDFVRRMQREGSSWITETGNGTMSRTRLMSSFSYSASSMFGQSTPVTPVTPRTTFTRPASSGSSAATPHSKAGSGNQRTRTVSSLTNSWITEPTESGITMTSWHFDSREEVPPVPALTASTKARYGVPASTSQPAITPLAHATAETTFYGEGPSIIRIGDPADMTFASYDSLPIKHGKRSTNFEILSPPAKSRPSKSPSVVSFRRRNRRTPSEDSEESFHSAVNDPTQSIESGGIRLYPNQSFPQSVSVSFEEVFCDAPGASAVDTASIRTDAIETVAKDEDERNSATGKTLEMHNRLGHLPSVPSNGQRQASAYASSSASEILMPISVGISGNPVVQPELPGMPKRSCGTYSPYSSRASPMFGMFIAGGEKNSTDPLLMRGKTSVASGAVGWPAGVLVDRQETTQPGIHNGTAGSPEELGNERQFRQLSWVILCNLLMLWISFGFATPLLVETSEADILGAILYLLSIALPVISLVASWVTLKGLLVTRHLRQEKRTSKLRSFKLQPLQAAEGKLEQTSAHFNTTKFSEWSTVLRDRMLLRKLNSLKTSNAGFPGDISLRDNQERMTPGESDRMFNLSVPQRRLSMPSPVANVRKTITRDFEDNEDTPRPPRSIKQSSQLVPLNKTTEVNHNRLSAYSMLREQGGRASSPGDYPSSPNRTDVTISRPDSLASSPGTKSIKLASVQQAVRGRMSLGPTFLIGGSQGETMFTAGRSLDLEAAIRTEIGDLNRKQGQSEWAHTGEAFGSSRSTPRLSHDPSNLQSANRRSTDILGEYNKQTIKQERRRTFDFGRVWSGWKRLHEKSLEDSALAFVDVNPERLEAIMMSDLGNTKTATHIVDDAQMSTCDYHDTFGGEMSFSIIRESNDLPAFRPSSDFILPGRQRDHPSIDFGRPSIAQDDRASFSVEGCGDTCFSTPRYQPQRNGSRGPGSTLPEMTAVNFLAEFKGAIREMGMRAEDTPVREAVRSVLAGLATPHVATKKGSSTSIRSILKKRPSSEVMRIASARSLGHSLPPIPIDIAKAVSRKGSTYSIASTGRSTPIFVPEEEYTSASHITLSLPPPRNVRSNGKSSIGPLSVALHPVSEREEPVLRCDIVESASENNIDRLGVIPPQPSHFVPVSDKVSELVSDNIHGRSSSTNTAIEEIETIMTMDSPTTASYLKTHLSRPNSLATENYVVATSAPASAHPHTLQASQSTQRTGSHSALKSSRSTPAFVISTDWSSSRATADAKNGGHTKDHARPSSTYSYLEKELGLPRLPDRVVITSAKRGSRAETKIGTQRQLLSEVTGNAVRAAHTFSVAKETGRTTKVKGSLAAATSSSPEQVGKPRVADENGQSSPRKGVRKLKVKESTRVGEKDASLKVMRF